MAMVIQGPPLANAKKLSHADLVRHAQSLEEYGWRVFGVLQQQADLAQTARDVLRQIIAAHETGNVQLMVQLIQQCAEAKRQVEQALQRAH
ncbi:hypothetical protein [Cupriavidus metallidurans]|uniref:Uncharacterized protein n=1 Tax=Cupriavidus metallidurans TaxID=119219 RepID=A0A482IL43_9BURK|nr:hypothetical protein [Cupriavidus metallidurans]QBP09825.1 hypothetical protein DDF84_008660 [Cupriavidus metallidurans]